MTLLTSKNWLPLLALALPVFAMADELEYSQQAFQLPAESENLIVADSNGDGLNDLLLVMDDSIRIYFQDDDGFDFDAGYQTLQFPGQAVGWNLSSRYSESGAASIIALIDGTDVLAWHIEERTIQEPQLIKSGLNGFLSRGVNRLYFSRDVNGDGIDDLIIPGAGMLNIYISDGADDYHAGLSVQSDLRMRTNLGSARLERRTGQSIRIPLIELRDVNGDGFDDLVSRTDEKLDVFIASNSATRYFPAQASYSLDIGEIEERLGDFDIDNLDFSNLTGVLALTHEEILDDVNGDGIDDLLLREGGKVSLFGGNASGMEFDQPRQVLRSGGNVLSTFLYDEDEDGLKDLWLWRVEPISVGDIFIWLALSGSVAIEAFIYPNDGERFSRRPTRKLTVDLKFPSVIRLATSFREIANEAEQIQEQQSIPSSSANLDSDISSEDLLLLVNNQVEIFLNSIEPKDEAEPFLGALGYSRQRDNYEIDIREIIDNISFSGNSQLDRLGGETADLSIELNASVVNGDIIPAQLNNDGLDDVFVFTAHDSSHIRGILLLSKQVSQ